MKTKKHITVLAILITFEFLLLLFVGRIIYTNYKNVLGTKNVVNIDKEVFTSTNNTQLAGYYEPEPNKNSIPYTNVVNTDWLEYEPKYTINSDGLNDSRQFSVQKQENTIRIITLGDSFTFGYLVDTGKSWPNKLEYLLKTETSCSPEVINLGVPGYDIKYSVERYRLHGQKYNPDIVIWFLKDDDFTEIRELVYKEFQLLPGHDSKDLEKSTDLWLQALNTVGKRYTETEKDNYKIEAIRGLRNYYAGKLVIVTFGKTATKNKKLIRSALAGNNASHLTDSIPNLQNEGESFPDTHPTEKGHSVIANALMQYLQTNSLTDCN